MSYRKDIAKIACASLGYESHGILTVYLSVDYGGGVCRSIGGYGLDAPHRDENDKHVGRFGTAYGCEFIARTMKACGVDEWSKIEGRTIYVLQDLPEGSSVWGSSSVVGIENLPTEPGCRFIFGDLRDEMTPITVKQVAA